MATDPESLLRKVYTDNFPWLENYIRKNSGNREDAEDVFQESISAAWLNVKQGRFDGDATRFNAYLRQICKYKWINRLRSVAGKKTSFEEDMTIYEYDGSITTELEEQIAQSRILDESFAGIGEKCKELLTLYYFKRASLANIALLMNNTEESIKTIKYRCMMKLRKIYLEKSKNDE